MADVSTVLLTGVPGVGKSSVARWLEERCDARYRWVPFGELIRQALNELAGSRVEEAQLRREPTSLVTEAVLEHATRQLVAMCASSARRVVVIVDSHAVSQDQFGFRSTPDGPSYFKALRYDAIVQLVLPGQEILDRTPVGTGGRQARSGVDLDFHSSLQLMVSTFYAAMSECPLFVVSADGAVSEVAARVDGVLTRVVGDRIS
ncbi:MAG TPA: AAA family ATPase [Candidatus Binatia bacterium]|nr:AAA family ATPase [Candidatus Binatia bacterium]